MHTSLLHSEYLLSAIHFKDGVDYLVNILLRYLQFIETCKVLQLNPLTLVVVAQCFKPYIDGSLLWYIS